MTDLNRCTPRLHPQTLAYQTSGYDPDRRAYVTLAARAALDPLDAVTEWLDDAFIYPLQLATFRDAILRMLCHPTMRALRSPKEARQLQQAAGMLERLAGPALNSGHHVTVRHLNPAPRPVSMQRPAGPLAETYVTLARLNFNDRRTSKQRAAVLKDLLTYGRSVTYAEIAYRQDGAEADARQRVMAAQVLGLALSLSCPLTPQDVDLNELGDHAFREVARDEMLKLSEIMAPTFSENAPNS